MHNYDTMTEALTDLKTRGFQYDFNLEQGLLYCPLLQRGYEAPQLMLKETYRFEGDTDPADEAIVYAIATDDGVQGTFVNGYGTYADTDMESLLKGMKIE